MFNPIWISEYKLRSKIKSTIDSIVFSPSGKWLDVGCGLRPYEPYFPTGLYVGVDIEVSGRIPAMKAPDYYYDGRLLPFPDDSFEGVISTQVLEHVRDPLGLLAEMYRVIKPQGSLIISLPFVWQEHEEPYDFFRFTRFGITELLEQAGFKVDSMITDAGAIETLAMVLTTYITHNIVPPIRGFGSIIALVVCFPIQLLALTLQWVLPDQGKIYLNLVIQASKIKTPCPKT